MIPPPVYHPTCVCAEGAMIDLRSIHRWGDYRGGAGVKKKKAYVYVLQSLKTGGFYLGRTTDLWRRLDQHNVGTVRYTRKHKPWNLLAYEVHQSVESATERERTLKRRHRMKTFFIKRALAVPQGSCLEYPIGIGPSGRRQVGG